MAFLIPTNAVQIARFANGLYGLQLGFASTNGIVSDVASGGLLPTFNNYYTLSFGSQTTASVAQQILTNLGIVASPTGLSATAVSAALAYVTGQLNAAAPNARGAAVKGILDLWSSISADPVNGPIYGATATTWNNTISAAVQYAGAVNPDVTVAQAVAINLAKASAPISYAAVSGTDAFTGSSAAPNTVSAVANGTSPTFTSGDSFTGGTGQTNTLLVSDAATAAGTWQPLTTGALTVNGFQNITFTSGVSAITANVTTSTFGLSGLTSLTLNPTGGSSVTLASLSPTSITVNDNAAAAANETINGGTNVTVTANGITTSATGRVTVGATTAPVGAVSITTGQAAYTDASRTSDIIQSTGGTTVNITENLTAPTIATFGTANYSTAGAITVTGGAASTTAGGNATGTTSVSVTQTKSAGATITATMPTTLANGSSSTITTTNTAGQTFIYTVANTTGGNVTGAQVAAVFAGSTTVPNLTLTYSNNGSNSFSLPSSTNPQPVWSIGASAGSTVVLSANTGQGTAQTAPTLGGTNVAATPTATSATGGILVAPVTISDANGLSATAANTISSITLSGLMVDPAGVGTVINDAALTNLSLANIAGGVSIAASTAAVPPQITINNNAAVPTATTLNLTTNQVTVGIVDTNSEYTLLNITTAGTTGSTGGNSTVTLNTGWNNVNAINVSGTSQVSLNSTGMTKLATITVSGAAGLTISTSTTFPNIAQSSSFPALKTITSTSSGVINIAMDVTADSFTSTGTGRDIITATAPATQVITAGKATNNMYIYNAAAPASLVSGSGSVTGFTVLGTGSSSSGAFNMTTLNGGLFNAIQVTGATANNSVSFTSVVPGTPLSVDTSGTTSTINYTTTSTTGGTTSLPLTLGVAAADSRVASGAASTTKLAFTLNALNLQDAVVVGGQLAPNGVGTLNVVSNNSYANQANIITTLSDTGLLAVNNSGTGGLTITNFTNGVTSSLAWNNASTSTLASGITNLTNPNLSSLSFGGSGPILIGTLIDTGSTLSIATTNSNTVPVTITTLTDTNMSALSVSGTGAVTIANDNIILSTYTGFTNTSSGALTVTTLTTSSATNFTLGGTGPITIGTFVPGGAGGTAVNNFTIVDSDTGAVNIPFVTPSGNGTAIATETFINSGTGTFTVGSTFGVVTGTNLATALVTLNLVGNVQYTITGTSATYGAGGGTAPSTLVTVNAPSDNANLALVTNATGGTALNVTLGNGTNTFTAVGLTNTGTQRAIITLGTGSNTLTLGDSGAINTGVAQGSGSTFNITVPAHPGATDRFNVWGLAVTSNASMTNSATANAEHYINGAVVGDSINFLTTPATVTSVIATPAQFTANPGVANLTAAMQAADASITIAGGTASFVSGGNTYIINDNNTSGWGATNVPTQTGIVAGVTVVEVTGVHTISSTVNGVVTLLT